MPAMDWIVDRNTWYKECSNRECRRGFQVNGDEETARELMREYFNIHHTTADRLSSECKSCGSNKRLKRELIHREELLEAQGGRCKLCNIIISFKNRTACVDHCHKSGKTRGILCYRCNSHMGLVDDYNNEGWLAKAIAYRDSYE
jgi:hypothetical protein